VPRVVVVTVVVVVVVGVVARTKKKVDNFVLPVRAVDMPRTFGCFLDGRRIR